MNKPKEEELYLLSLYLLKNEERFLGYWPGSSDRIILRNQLEKVLQEYFSVGYD